MTANILLLLGGLFVSGAILIALEHKVHRVPPNARSRSWLKFSVYLGFVLLLVLVRRLGSAPAFLLIGTIAIAALRELRIVLPTNRAMALWIWTGIVLGLGHLLHRNIGFQYWAATILLVSATDAFAQLAGKLWGSHRLCPTLSPGKTVEGLVGGLLAAGLLASAIGFLLPGVDLPQRIVLGLATGAAAVVGDLAFSCVKRWRGVKDFSNLIPGHGGILDRVDSLVLGAPVFYWTLAALGAGAA